MIALPVPGVTLAGTDVFPDEDCDSWYKYRFHRRSCQPEGTGSAKAPLLC